MDRFIFVSLTFLIPLFSFNVPGQTDQLSYDIYLNGKKVGYMSVSRKGNAETTSYAFASQVRYSLLKEFDIRFSIQSLYRNGNLIRSSADQKVNGEVKASCKVTKETTGYSVVADGKESWLSAGTITYSLTSLYFSEPGKNGHVFSERYGRFLPVRETGTHMYLITMPEGSENVYRFSGGICQEVSVDILFGKLEFKLQTN